MQRCAIPPPRFVASRRNLPRYFAGVAVKAELVASFSIRPTATLTPLTDLAERLAVARRPRAFGRQPCQSDVQQG